MKLRVFLNCCCQFLQEDKLSDSDRNKIEKKKFIKNNSSDLPEFVSDDNIILYNSSEIFPAYPKLIIKIIDSLTVPEGTTIKINPQGMENSKRNKPDGKTFIGSQLCDGKQILNDFVISEAEQGMGKQQLLIRFRTPELKYTLTSLCEGSGTFAKIQSEISLKTDQIISFGFSQIKITGVGTPFILEKRIFFMFIEGPNINQEYFFYPGQTITIGRMTDCKIRVNDNNLSRYHCSIRYKQSEGWVIKDGHENKDSTNGTWLLVNDNYELCNTTTFKAGRTVFEASIINNYN